MLWILSRVFGRTSSKMINFGHQKARLVMVSPQISPAQALDKLKLSPYKAVIIIHSGAGGMTDDDLQKLRAHIEGGVAKLAQNQNILLVDGGTESGTMKLLGQARRKLEGTFPLLGVTISESITYPGGPTGENRFPLESNHSHFLIVKASEFGAESELIVGMATASNIPHLAMIINGGAIVRAEAERHAQNGTPLVVLKGSGRYADELANSTPDSEIRAAFPPNAKIEIFDTQTGTPAGLYALLKLLLGL